MDIGTAAGLVFAGMVAAATAINSYVQFRTLRQSERNHALGRVNEAALHEIHLTMNSRLDMLLKAATAQAYGEGIAAERAANRVDPEVTALAAANVLTTTREAKAAVIFASGLQPIPVHVVTDDAPVAVQVIPTGIVS